MTKSEMMEFLISHDFLITVTEFPDGTRVQTAIRYTSSGKNGAYRGIRELVMLYPDRMDMYTCYGNVSDVPYSSVEVTDDGHIRRKMYEDNSRGE